jgi:hypothetical protein
MSVARGNCDGVSTWQTVRRTRDGWPASTAQTRSISQSSGFTKLSQSGCQVGGNRYGLSGRGVLEAFTLARPRLLREIETDRPMMMPRGTTFFAFFCLSPDQSTLGGGACPGGNSGVAVHADRLSGMEESPKHRSSIAALSKLLLPPNVSVDENHCHVLRSSISRKSAIAHLSGHAASVVGQASAGVDRPREIQARAMPLSSTKMGGDAVVSRFDAWGSRDRSCRCLRQRWEGMRSCPGLMRGGHAKGVACADAVDRLTPLGDESL